MANGENLKGNGQDKNFCNYGGIEDLTTYVNEEYGQEWKQIRISSIKGVLSFLQSSFGPNNDNNCTLASITRIMKYFSYTGLTKIPSEVNVIYKKVREIGVGHGYDPCKSGILRDLFIYTPFEIAVMVRDFWRGIGYQYKAKNHYFKKLKVIIGNVDKKKPVLLNIASGDYKGHTVTVTGYIAYARASNDEIYFIQIFDGWSETVRYIDWKKFGNTLANVTTVK